MFISEQSFRNTLLGPGFQWGVGPSSHIKTPALIFSNANINTPVFKLIGCMHQDITVLSCKKFITGKRILIFFLYLEERTEEKQDIKYTSETSSSQKMRIHICQS